ncbi:MAG: hypothetical protein HQ591_05125 [candidate division Zixibacteria bacterium]|nr:hypothetical protein [Candidatus Tariuqbacter arcticus]
MKNKKNQKKEPKGKNKKEIEKNKIRENIMRRILKNTWLVALVSVAIGYILGAFNPLDKIIYPKHPTYVTTTADGYVVLVMSQKEEAIKSIRLDSKVKAICPIYSKKKRIKQIAVGTMDGEKAGYLILFDINGNRIDEFNTCDSTIIKKLRSDYKRPVYSNRFTVYQIEHILNSSNEKKYLVCIGNDWRYFTGRQLVFELEQDSLIFVSDLWHKGHINSFHIEDLNNDDNREVISKAILNERKIHPINSHCVFCTNLNKYSTMTTHPEFVPDMEEMDYNWYIVMLPKDKDDGFSRITIEDFDNDGEKDVCAQTVSGLSYYINYDGKLIGRVQGDTWTYDHSGEPIPDLYYLSYVDGEPKLDVISMQISEK